MCVLFFLRKWIVTIDEDLQLLFTNALREVLNIFDQSVLLITRVIACEKINLFYQYIVLGKIYIIFHF